MTDFTITNKGNGTLLGTAGEDRLSFTYDTTTNDVWLTSLSPAAVGASAPVAGGYSGLFDGMGSNDAWFSGIEHFTFTDLSGGNDDIRAGDGDDVLNGGAGNDKLAGWGGVNRIDGGSGTDFAQLAMGWTSAALYIDVNGTSTFLGNGLLTNVEGVDLTTGSGNDTVIGHQGSGMRDVVRTGGGNDSITLAMGGSDTVDGGAGSDLLALTYSVETNDVWLTNLAVDTVSGGYKGLFDGYGSNDVWFSGIERFSFTDASGGNDNIRTGDGADTLNGGAGDDRLDGKGGADVIDGGLGKDHWGGHFATAGSAFKIDLNGVSTLLTSGSVKNIEAMALTTGSGNDTITGHQSSAMADSVKSGAGSDSIRLWMGGSDTVDGGAGSDVLTVTYNVVSNGVWLTNLAVDTVSGGYKGLFDGYGSNDVWFSGIERFSFTDASGGNDNIRTGDGADTLNGGAGNDALNGGGGNDVLNGGAGADTMLGGAGDDTYHVDDIGDRVYETTTIGGVTNAGGVDTVLAYLSSCTLGDFVENGRIMSTGTASLSGNSLGNLIHAGKGSNVLVGGSGTDTLSYAYGANGTTGVKVSLASTTAQATGGSGSDRISGFERLTGSANSDSLTGSSGANIIKGGGGNDTVTGGGGSDSLYGDAGNDLLRGGAGNDVLYGGAGRDLFRFDAALSTATVRNVDKIMDFSVVDDTIQLENAFFTKFGTTTTGTIASGNFRANTAGRAADANDYIVYETDTGKLFYDADGSAAGAAVEVAVIGTNLALTYADFVLV